MIVVAEETKDLNVMRYFPLGMRKYLYKLKLDEIEEIRLRRLKPVMIKTSSGKFPLKSNGVPIICDEKMLDETVLKIFENSFYTYKERASKGYITLEGGHRVGIAASFTKDTFGNLSVSDVSGLNFRIAHQHYGVSDSVLSQLGDGKSLKNTLIISPPGCGKTTFLCDMVRNISHMGVSVCVVDERSELFSLYNGIPSYDTGDNTDILDNIPKKEGMEIALRTLSPDVIVTDEIGRGEEEIIRYITKCGVSVIASVHGDKNNVPKSITELFENKIYIDAEHIAHIEVKI